MKSLRLIALLFAFSSAVWAAEREPIRLADDPALSPDGSLLAFSWRGDIWIVPTEGGAARPVTQHPALDTEPHFSPDGKMLAFVSRRENGPQVYLVPVAGGLPERLTAHTSGYRLEDWFPGGRSLLVSGSRDHFWTKTRRFFRISTEERTAETLLFDAYGAEGSLSPDGERLLFVREGYTWWRKGYVGPLAGQIWMADLETETFTKLVDRETESRWPLWKPDGSGFYYVSAQSGSMNLWERDLGTGQETQLTFFEDDSVVFPALSRDGSTIVFRHLFDFYRLRPREGGPPVRIEIWNEGDRITPDTERRTLKRASEVAFTDDGLEVAFIADGDLWVMDTELREPKRVTDTPEPERSPVFGPDGETLYFVSDRDGQSDIWKAERADPDRYWWLNEEFTTERITADAEVERDLQFSPDGKRLAYVRGLGDLWTIDPDGKNPQRLLESWNRPDYAWSPDGKWIAYAVDDNDFNRDIWIVPSDGSAEPFNLSRHPDTESEPVWSPDGKLLAFVGERVHGETDIYYVWLAKEEDDKTKRDRTLEKALEKMKKKRKEKKKKAETTKAESDDEAATTDDEAEKETESDEAPEESKDAEEEEKTLPEVVIDFEGLTDRIRRVSIPNSRESGLFWSHDSKKLAFRATVDGKAGTYTIEIPEDLKPKRLTEKTGSHARWLEEENVIVWLSDGVPGRLTSKGEATAYDFAAKSEVDRRARNRVAFELAWRTMRDEYYDENLGNRDWDAIRRKYLEMATEAVDHRQFATVVNLMLGELNGSHLGFRASGGGWKSPDQWNVVTAHLGVRFVRGYEGPGLKVRDVLPRGPADRVESRIEPGEIVLSIDGVSVDPSTDLTAVLNGPLDRDIRLKVRNADGEERDVVLRPISYGAARNLLYDKWVRDNERRVEALSEGRLGYLHVRGMNWSSFLEFERKLYAVGAGKDGLIIDVRNNGGGWTTDHLLTALTQPTHAITVPRGGGPGYPQGRRVYATWNKPIVVLCNQNSFSNAEIFAHAIQTLKRGRLVGVRTAGGVISTGGRSILDKGFLRIPFRGWFLLNGEDMELNGAVPDIVVWPEPGEMPQGRDRQLEKAVEALLEDVEKWKVTPRPTLRKASERGKP